MRLRVFATGVLILVLGALFLALPGVSGEVGSAVGLVPAPTQSLRLVGVAPGNYTYLTYTLQPGDQLSVTLSSSPQPVDFYLMDGGNFSLWTRGGAASTQPYLYPQSAFGVKNYTFGFTGGAESQAYYLVFVSRSTTSATNVLVQTSVQGSAALVTGLIPEGLLGLGLVVMLAGVRLGRGKAAEEVGTAPVVPPSNKTQPERAPSGPTCRYCGAPLKEGSGFCPSCGRSVG